MPIDLFEQQSGGKDLFAEAGITQIAGGQGVMPPDPANPVPGGQPSTMPRDALNVLSEFAAAANRSVTEFIDFVGPDTVNTILRRSGSDYQMPTLTGSLESTGIRGGFMQPGFSRDTVQTLGTAGTMGAGVVPVTRNLAKAGPAIAEFMGVGAAKTPAVLTPALEQKLAVLRQTGDTNTAKVMLDPSVTPGTTGTADIIDDPLARETIRQGFDEGFIAMVKTSPALARQKMSAMVDVVKKGKENFRYAADNRPLDIAGDSILARFKVVREANRMAGTRLDGVAEELKGVPLDPQPAVKPFLESLKKMGIVWSPDGMKLNFRGSDIEKLKGPQRVILNIVDRMLNTKAPDAHDIHRLKRFIDEQVTYGKNKKGLGGKTETILKTLRHDLDAMLDQNFPKYNQVNTQYAETIGALDALQDVAGRKMDLLGPNADKAVGTLSRRLLSNAQSRIPLKDAINQLDTVAKKYTSRGGTDIVPYRKVEQLSGVKSADLDDDIMGQVMFVDELEKMFGTQARTSLQGDASKVAQSAVRGMKGSAYEAVTDAAVAGIDKLSGVNEKRALKAMKELLESVR